MSHFADLAAGIAAVNASYYWIEHAVENDPKAGDIERQLAARVLLDLWPILEKLNLRSPISTKFGTAAQSVSEFQREYKCLEDL